jgi:hypothetical protein
VGRAGGWCVALAGVVLVAGCGGGASSGFTPPKPGAVGSAVASAEAARGDSPPPVVAGSPAPRRTLLPDLVFPADFTVVYEQRPAKGKAAAQAVRAFGEFWTAWWYAVATEGRDLRYRAYVAPDSDLSGTGLFARVVAEWGRERVRPTGVIRAHAVRVLSVRRSGIALVACGDESGAGTRNITTGQVSWTFGRQPASRYKIRIMMIPGPRGGWQVGAYQPVTATTPPGRECR